jgi:hypothetical protein
VPDFAAAAPSPMISSPMIGAPGPMIAAVPPAPTGGGRRNSGGGKGLVIGLGAVGGILLIAIAVLAARSMSSKKDDLPPIALPESGAGTTGNSGAIGTASVANIEPISPPTAVDPALPAVPSGKPQTGVEPVKPSGGTGKTATPPPVSPAQACDACISAASGGNITGAAGNFARCTDAAKKAQCSQAAKTNAPRAAKTAALNGNCSLAKGIISAAQSLGATSGALLSSLAGSSCK